MKTLSQYSNGDWLVVAMVVLEIAAFAGYLSHGDRKTAVYWLLCAAIGVNMVVW